MKKIFVNEFQEYNDKGLFPELNPFGTGKENGYPYYEFVLYMKGVDRSICLRRGAPSTGEPRTLALQRLSETVDVVLTFESMLSNPDFWQGYDWLDYQREKDNEAFKAGRTLRKKLKEISDIWYKD